MVGGSFLKYLRLLTLKDAFIRGVSSVIIRELMLL